MLDQTNPLHTDMTTSQGPSAQNQTSDDHSLDSNQAARQPTTNQVIKDSGLDMATTPDSPNQDSSTPNNSPGTDPATQSRQAQSDIDSGDTHSRTEGQPDGNRNQT